MNQNMEWKWTKKKPMAALTLQPGSQRTIELPIEARSGAPIRIQWSSPDMPSDFIKVDPEDNRLVTLNVPSDLYGFFTIKYRIEATPKTDGSIKIRIQRLDSTVAESRGNPAEIKPTSNLLPEPSPPEDVFESRPEGLAVGIDGELSNRKSSSGKQTSVCDHLGSDLPVGDYWVEVVRQGVAVKDLRTPVRRYETLMVGKFSPKLSRVPDVDLKGQFGPSGQEEMCSHEQAEIFWSDNKICILCRGRNPLQIKGASEIAAASAHWWQPGERIVVPGGLELDLVKE